MKVPGLLAARRVALLRDRILAELKRVGVWSAGRSLSSAMTGMPAFQQTLRLGQLVRISELVDDLATDEVLRAVHALGGSTIRAMDEAQLLLSLPRKEKDARPTANWHVDLASDRPETSPGVQVFALIDDLDADGGGTRALAGSHRPEFTRGPGRDDLRSLLAHEPDPSTERLPPGLASVAMSGRAGDVYLMDMRVLHTPSVNRTSRLRMMATVRCFVAG